MNWFGLAYGERVALSEYRNHETISPRVIGKDTLEAIADSIGIIVMECKL